MTGTTIEITQTQNVLEIQDDESVNVIQEILEILEIGTPGPPGATPGATYIFGSAATTWTINHNLGYKPVISCYTVGGIEVVADIVHTSDNQAIVYFSTATAGAARVI